MSEVFAVGDWCRYRRHRTPYRIIDRQSLWNEMGFRVWLPTKDAIIRARASDLAPLASLEPTKNEILHTAARGSTPVRHASEDRCGRMESGCYGFSGCRSNRR